MKGSGGNDNTLYFARRSFQETMMSGMTTMNTMKTMNAMNTMNALTMWQRRLAFTLVLVLVHVCALNSFAHQEVPGEKQKKPIALTNARLHTITNGVMDSATIVFDKGVITAVGRNVSIPAGCEVRDLKGKYVYPSFIAPYTTLG